MQVIYSRPFILYIPQFFYYLSCYNGSYQLTNPRLLWSQPLTRWRNRHRFHQQTGPRCNSNSQVERSRPQEPTWACSRVRSYGSSGHQRFWLLLQLHHEATLQSRIEVHNASLGVPGLRIPLGRPRKWRVHESHARKRSCGLYSRTRPDSLGRTIVGQHEANRALGRWEKWVQIGRNHWCCGFLLPWSRDHVLCKKSHSWRSGKGKPQSSESYEEGRSELRINETGTVKFLLLLLFWNFLWISAFMPSFRRTSLLGSRLRRQRPNLNSIPKSQTFETGSPLLRISVSLQKLRRRDGDSPPAT